MKYNLDEKAIIFLDGFLNLEYKHKRNIIDLFETPSELFKNLNIVRNYLNSNGLTKYSSSLSIGINEDFVERIIQKYNERGIIAITEVSENYPKTLLNLPINPICLYAKGNVSLLTCKDKFSIVGSRKTIPQYLKLTEDISKDLTNSGVIIVTGVALGGDLSAIKGGLDSGKLILVLAGGLDFIKQEINRDYINKVIENNGLVITEYPPEVPTLAYHYPVRNRIIAGISDGTLIVSGDNKSGTRHTASFALDYGKEVFAFPYTIGTPNGELPNSLIKDGAYLVLDTKDITEVLQYNFTEKQKISLSTEEEKVLSAIKNGKTLFDDIIVETNFKIYELMPILTTLEIKGVIVKANGNEYLLLN